ncbi:hypothetical protein Emag_007287 [Eimeria magna]
MQPPAKLQRTATSGGPGGPTATTSVAFSMPPTAAAVPSLRLSNSSTSSSSNVDSSAASAAASAAAGTAPTSPWGVVPVGSGAGGGSLGGPPSSKMGAPAAGASSRPRFNMYSSSKRILSCPFCTPNSSSSSGGSSGSTIVLDSSSGDQLCRECGYVLEERVLNEEQEWRSFSTETSGGGSRGADRNRVGEALDGWLEDGGIGTSMLIGGATASKGLGSGRRLQMLHEAATSGGPGGEAGARDRQLRAAFNYLRLIGEAFSLRDHVLERAKEIAKELLDSGQLRSRSTAVSMLAITYLACREAGLLSSGNNQQTLLLPKASEIASVTGAGEHTLRSIYKDMLDVAEHLLPTEFQPTVEGGVEALRSRTSRKRKTATTAPDIDVQRRVAAAAPSLPLPSERGPPGGPPLLFA